jgi:hypothetical protein
LDIADGEEREEMLKMQISFVIDAETESRFKDYIQQDMGMTMLFQEEDNSYAKIHDFYDSCVPGWFIVWLYKEGLNDFSIVNDNAGKIDTMVSNVIELKRTTVHEDKRVVPGRLWLSASYYNDEGEKIKKSDAFIDLYKRLASWVRKNAKRRTFTDARGVEWTEYITDSILELLEKEGYRLY